MNIDLQTIKDIVLISVPIITAYFTYRANKKSKKELNNELEVRLREQDNETANEIKKMQKQLEVRNMENSWNTSTPTTQKYLDEVDVRRSGNVMSLQNLIPTVQAPASAPPGIHFDRNPSRQKRAFSAELP